MLKSILMPRVARRLYRKASRVVRGFQQSRSGVAATEFALMVPAMLMIWIGMVVATDAFTADKKVTLLTRTLADMTTQMQAVSQADMDSIFQATEAVLWPKSADAMGMRVTSYDIDGSGKVFVDWSVVPSNSALRGDFTATARCSTSTEVPVGLRVARTSIVLAEVSMKYKASIASQMVDELFKGSISGGQLPLGDRLFMRARQSNKVMFNPTPGSNCPGYVS
jgi:Flp pilus assembly protein TadG